MLFIDDISFISNELIYVGSIDGVRLLCAGGAANGFDTTSTNNPSMLGYNKFNQSWLVQTSTNQ